MIEFDKVSKRYPCGHEALDRVSFRIERDDMVFLTGHSGAGKSTLLKLIMLMEQPSSGQVVVDVVHGHETGPVAELADASRMVRALLAGADDADADDDELTLDSRPIVERQSRDSASALETFDRSAAEDPHAPALV